MYKRFALAAIVVVLSSAGAVATAALLEIKDDTTIFFGASGSKGHVKAPLDGVDPGGPQTILLLGSDQRYVDIKAKNPVRSDTIILLRLDPAKGATTVMSLPRDLKVHIPGHGNDKLNAAYAIGGPALAVKTIRTLLGTVPINHVVNVNFGGFRRAVDRLGCVYTDVDRRYFNDNSPPFGGGGDYATIDVKAGYQKLCGQDALDFVRYRHFDTDLVRAARQQQFLADAKDQIGVGKLFSDRKALLRIFGRYTQTDITSSAAILRLLKLAFESARNPVQEIRFPGDITGDYVTVTQPHLAAATKRFMNAAPVATPKTAAPKTTTTKKKGHKAVTTTTLPPGMQTAGTGAEDEAVQLAAKLPFSVYYPKAAITGASMLPDHSRAYDIFDRGGHKYRAYRMVFKTSLLGQYYGVEGTNWEGPPILDNPSERRKLGGRDYELFYDGSRLRLVSWRMGKSVYWISNTLLSSLGNQQMLALARSVGRIR